MNLICLQISEFICAGEFEEKYILIFA